MPSPKLRHSRTAGGNEIEHLHQGLRYQPGIATEQRPFLAAQRAVRRRRVKFCREGRISGRRGRSTRRRNRIFAKARRDERNYGGKQCQTQCQHTGERKAVTESGVRRPPDKTIETGDMRHHDLRFNDRRTRQRAVGHDRGHQQADDKRSADHRGNDLCHEPRAFRSDQAKQRHRQPDRKRGRRRAHRDDQSVSAQPAPTAARDQHVDKRRRERQCHQRHRERDGCDAHREEFRCGRGRRQDEIEVGVGVERARRRFHGLRHHQQP
ncbi:MAG: hypothetical protein WBD90_00955 [Xanthobacteraceae bacterium]